jgi:hypothetical protein
MAAIGLLATDSTGDPMRVNLPRDLHLGDTRFNSLEIGQIVPVEILKSRFQTNDPYIQTVGILESGALLDKYAERDSKEGKAPE